MCHQSDKDNWLIGSDLVGLNFTERGCWLCIMIALYKLEGAQSTLPKMFDFKLRIVLVSGVSYCLSSQLAAFGRVSQGEN